MSPSAIASSAPNELDDSVQQLQNFNLSVSVSLFLGVSADPDSGITLLSESESVANLASSDSLLNVSVARFLCETVQSRMGIPAPFIRLALDVAVRFKETTSLSDTESQDPIMVANRVLHPLGLNTDEPTTNSVVRIRPDGSSWHQVI